ncbi:hypothetical protein IJF85_01475 [Candidatus Saccharibacteria bacterium]|nr:hypothetical protein [Candidatus Saccharibacteria bacterium]
MASSELPDYATVEKLEAYWKNLSDNERSRSEVIIHYASSYLRQIATNNGVNLDAKIADDENGILAENVEMVVLNAVQREMSAPTDMVPDATNWSQSASPYSESMSFSAGISNNLYFKAKELQLLGLNSVSGKSQISILEGVR